MGQAPVLLDIESSIGDQTFQTSEADDPFAVIMTVRTRKAVLNMSGHHLAEDGDYDEEDKEDMEQPTPGSALVAPKSLGYTTWQAERLQLVTQLGEGGQAVVWLASIDGSETFCIKMAKVSTAGTPLT